MHLITRGFKVTAYGKIKYLAAILSMCSFYCFLDRPSCISLPAQEMAKFSSHRMKGAGQRSAGSPCSLEKNQQRASGFSALFMATAVSRHRARTRPTDTAVPWACARWRATCLWGPPTLRDSLSLCGKPELGNTGKCSALLWALIPPQHVSLQLNENQSFQNSLHTSCNYSTAGTTKLRKVSLLQSLVESLVSHHIIKS